MISDFYKRLFPPFGLRALAVFKNGLQNPPAHTFYDNDEDLLAAAQSYDSLGKNVYHGCAVYETDANRKGENVKAVKSLWIDADVGPTKPYDTAKEAATDIEGFRIKLGLPAPSIVVSGNGVHAYFHFTKAIESGNWSRVASAFAECLDHYGVKHDTSRTQDKASILRIPGTSNYKSNPPKDVKLKRVGDEIAVGEFYQKLKDYATANGVILSGGKPKAGKVAGPSNDIVGNSDKNHAPSESPLILPHCEVLREVDESGGDVSYEIWWRALGVAKFTTTPDETAARWTRNRIATGHDQDDWKGLMDEWAAGPTTCANFSQHSSKCAACPKFGKLSTPLHLGTPAIPAVATVTPPPQTATFTKPQMAQPWDFKAQWILNTVNAATRVGFTASGAMTRTTTAEDGTHRQTTFCDRYWQVMKRVRRPAGEWQMEIAYEMCPGRPYQTSMLDPEAVPSPDMLRKAFSARELHIYGGKPAMDKAADVIKFEQDYMYRHEEETKTYPTMGWANDTHDTRGQLTGEFVIGNTVISPNEPPREAQLSDTVASSVRAAFKVKGTTAMWVDLVNHIYNRPGAEAYQFLIASAFASPLVKLVTDGGEWHGIPIVVTGDSGAAKTSTCLVAMSVYGYAQSLKFNASAGQGDTLNASTVKLGSLRNLPCIMDEMSGLDAERLADTFAALANGGPKDRMDRSGGLVKSPYHWDMLTLVNTNDKLHEVLEGLRSQHSTLAMQMRAFEVSLYSSDLKTVFHDVNKMMVEDDLLGNNYGAVGREWLQFVVKNREKISNVLKATRAQYMIDPNDKSNIRFYKDLIVTIKVAAMLAKQRGFIHWDVNQMIKWAESQLVSLRDNVSVTNWDATISDFVGSYHGRTITTRHMKIGPGRRAKDVELPLDNIAANALPVARKATEDKRFVFTVNSMKEWCVKHRVLMSTLRDEMFARGFFAVDPAVGKLETRMINIGSGTTITRPQTPCYELCYDKVAYADEGDSVDTSNVVQLNPVTVTVTEKKSDGDEAAVSP